jgi:hypothetical protein
MKNSEILFYHKSSSKHLSGSFRVNEIKICKINFFEIKILKSVKGKLDKMNKFGGGKRNNASFLLTRPNTP